MGLLQLEDLRQGIDRATARGAERDYDGADIAACKGALERVEAHTALVVGGDGLERDLEDFGQAAMRIVGLVRGDDGFAGMDKAGDPEGFEVGESATTGEVTEKPIGIIAKHGCDGGDGLLFHGAGFAAAVESVIVGIDVHGQAVSQSCHRMWWLEHLPGIKGVSVRIIVLHALGDIAEDGAHGSLLSLVVAEGLKWRQLAVAGGQDGEGFGEVAEAFVIKHVVHCSKVGGWVMGLRGGCGIFETFCLVGAAWWSDRLVGKV